MSKLIVGGQTPSGIIIADGVIQTFYDKLKAAAGPLNALDLRLVHTIPSPVTKAAVWADFAECDFSGYLPITTLVFDDAFLEDDKPTLLSLDPEPKFVHNGGVVANAVLGAVLTVTVGPDTFLKAFEIFDEPVTMAKAGDELIYVSKIRFPWNLK